MAADRSTAEFAVIVADPWQGKGLGEKLIERVIEIARDNEVKMIWGEFLAANLPMLGLVRKLGFTIKAASEGVRHVEMPLAVD
jgi:acetyltransferase